MSNRIGWSLIVAVLLSGGPIAAEEPPAARRTTFDIPAQQMRDALNDFGRQAGLSIAFYDDAVEHLSARALSGTYTPRAALNLLLRDFNLRYEFVNDRTVAIRAARPADTKVTSGAGARRLAPPAPIKLVRVESEPPPANEEEEVEEETEEQSREGQEILVTGSRIRGLVGEQTSQPVLTITGEEIRRYGVTSIAEVFRYIPQVSDFELGRGVQNEFTFGGAALPVHANRVTATLRGAPAGGTLMLINGRRVPKTGQGSGSQGHDAYDLGGIPLSAVERIDVLLDGASAVYGADAVGGVINVILKDDYNGTEARLQYENTFDASTPVKTASLTHGFSFGRLSGLVSASWEQADGLEWADRWFLRTYDRRFLGGVDQRFPGLYAGTGVVTSLTGILPGLGVPQAAIPAGSDGVNVTVEDYANAGPLPEIFDPGNYDLGYTPYERKNAVGNVAYEFHPALTVFAEARWNESTTGNPTLPISAFQIYVPFGSPGNPFFDELLVTKFFYDLPAPEPEATAENQGVTAGLRGDLFGGWRYEAAAHDVRSKPALTRLNTGLNFTRVVQALLFDPNPPILLYDSTAGLSPNSPGTLEELINPRPGLAERERMRSYDLQLDGPLFTLPTGEVLISFGAEQREERSEFPLPEGNLSIDSYERDNRAYFAEMRIPLASPAQGWPLVHRLEVNLAARHDSYSDFPDATTPRYGLAYRPVQWLMLRGSYGEGYKVPTLVQLYRPAFQSQGFVQPGSVLDPLRDGEPVVNPPGGLAIMFSGNSELVPESSENITAGIVMDMPFLSGLSLSLDYFKVEYTDRVSQLSLRDRLLLYPQTVARAAPLPSDPPGWPGPVIGYEDRPVNVALDRVAGYDLSVKYLWSTNRGEWTAQLNASKLKTREFRATPTQPLVASPPEPVQLVGSLFWRRGAMGMGVVGSFQDATRIPELPEPEVVSAATRWDVQASYDFAEGGWTAGSGASWMRWLLNDTRIDLAIFNVFDSIPPLYAGNSNRQPVEGVLDSRLRRYSLSLTRRF